MGAWQYVRYVWSVGFVFCFWSIFVFVFFFGENLCGSGWSKRTTYIEAECGQSLYENRREKKKSRKKNANEFQIINWWQNSCAEYTTKQNLSLRSDWFGFLEWIEWIEQAESITYNVGREPDVGSVSSKCTRSESSCYVHAVIYMIHSSGEKHKWLDFYFRSGIANMQRSYSCA